MKVLLFVLIIGFILFGGYPKFGFPTDIDNIAFEKNTRDREESSAEVILNSEDIAQLSEEIGYVWCSFFGLNSWESYPHYRLKLYYADGRTENGFISSSEFLSSCSSSIEIFSTIELMLTNKQINKD